jgi:threonine/homoserine/homoserine lactone efflux protein
MSPDLWFAFALTSAVLVAVPGPTVMLVISYALSNGRASGFATVPGVTLGDFIAMTTSLLGAGAVLALSATLFTVMKLVGAAYLVWLGVRLWRAEPSAELPGRVETRAGARRMFWNACLVTALNPKGIVFFIAFVPQFVDPARPMLPQFAILEATFLVLAAVNVTLWAGLAGSLQAAFRRPSTVRLFNRLGAGFLIGAGLLIAFRRPG